MPDSTYFHYLQPDYNKILPEISKEILEKIENKFELLYGRQSTAEHMPEIIRLLKVYLAHKSDQMLQWEKSFRPEERYTEKDAILITYGDLVVENGEHPLETLSGICKQYFKNVFNTLHILPFFPYSSDRGFAVMDFEEVDPRLGNWEDILNLKTDFNLMFDGVFNHVSSKSRWFQEFLNQNPEYDNFFTVFSTSEKISADHLKIIVRPRTSDILTSYPTLHGVKMVWTTFSPDQIDLNFKNPKVLLKMIEIMLLYIRRGADLLRLDAVTYLWEELGTSCAHLDQTHTTIQLFRDVLDAVAPHVGLVTETNVPHEDNIRYFGDGQNEAQMVYNFALPPLVLHTFQCGNSEKLTEWAAGLEKKSDYVTFFNFLDSHDGIGVMAVKNILSKEELNWMALKVIEHGGYISYKKEGDGSDTPYELNITWYSAINRDDDGEPTEIKIARYLASRAIALVLAGVPGIYLHGILGSKNDAEAVVIQKERRSINRKNLDKTELFNLLDDKNSDTHKVTSGLIKLLKIRNNEKCFHPNAGQEIIKNGTTVFSLLRISPDKSEKILAIINITAEPARFAYQKIGLLDHREWVDLVSKQAYRFDGASIEVDLQPYQICWLKNQ